MVKDLRLNVDGETHEVDSVDEAAELAERLRPDEQEELVAFHVAYSDGEWVATVADSDVEYEARDERKWGAIRKLCELVDERAQRFGY